jgi:hypothetical protein
MPQNRLYIGVEWHKYLKMRWPKSELESMARLDARWQGSNRATAFRMHCLNERKQSAICASWFGVGSPLRPSEAANRSRDNLYAATSLVENYEKSLVFWLLAAGVTFCEMDKCDTAADIKPYALLPREPKHLGTQNEALLAERHEHEYVLRRSAAWPTRRA